MTDTRFEQELKDFIEKGKVLIVAGTGVSVSASKGHPEASWQGLLKHGLNWVRKNGRIPERVSEAYSTLLEEAPETFNFITIATAISNALGGGQSLLIQDWLTETVGQIKAQENDLLDALHSLRKQGNLLATTNYDDLLLGDPPKLTPITWQDPEFLSVVRHGDKEKVLFLHGYWREYQSVVLDWNSYNRIARDQNYRENLSATWKTSPWLFVGCGPDGLQDPDFGLLLERYGKWAKQAGHYDYCLVRGNHQKQALTSKFKKLDYNIRILSYGENYSDLPAYIHSLLPSPPKAKLSTLNLKSSSIDSQSKTNESLLPKAPAFFAKPDYLGSHQFVGRRAELDMISDWANPSDPTNLLLFEAIGGNGKSMLTWEWVTNYSQNIRSDWAGRFWYSFYERGAYMQDFCQHALAYITNRPLKEFKKLKTLQMRDQLIAELHEKPWLLILDGLERVLVAYHRHDAAQIPDEAANAPTDEILNRNPCDTIRDEDNDLLRSLAGCLPSKILISSRLTPRVLTNPTGQAVPGVQRQPLTGLRPADAEALLKSCGVRGSSSGIRDYLQINCANHPLVIGVLAGLINQPGPYRGDFDGWSKDPCGGAQLDLGKLDLVQRRNHILRAAIEFLPYESREILSILALLSEAVDFETLERLSPNTKLKTSTPKFNMASTIRDLENRGLLQFDGNIRKYDLHPVVRGVMTGEMGSIEKKRFGQKVLDFFSEQPQLPFEHARTLADLSVPLNMMRTLIKMNFLKRAFQFYRGELSRALLFNLEAHSEVLYLLRPFFLSDWGIPHPSIDNKTSNYLINDVAIVFSAKGYTYQAINLFSLKAKKDRDEKDWLNFRVATSNISACFSENYNFSKALFFNKLSYLVGKLLNSKPDIFISKLHYFRILSYIGSFQKAQKIWFSLDQMGRNWSRSIYRQGFAECLYAYFQFYQGTLKENYLDEAMALAKRDNNRSGQRHLLFLKGSWQLESDNFEGAHANFKEAVRMCRERSYSASAPETCLVLTKLHLEQLNIGEVRTEADRLTQLHNPAHRYLAMLWREIGNEKKARNHALAAYRKAWADGTPYVHLHQLKKTKELLKELGIPIPELPPYDPQKEETFSWETDISEAIGEIRAEVEKSEKINSN